MSEAAGLAIRSESAGWERVKGLVLDAVSSPHSKRVYAKALEDFRSWAATVGEGFSKASVQRYRAYLEESGLAPSSINVRLSALRKLAQESADNGFLAPDIAAAIGRVGSVPQKGRRLGRWLSRDQASQLLQGSQKKGRRPLRDRALLCLLVGCGLRRSEAAGLTLDQIQQREGRWVLVDLRGKHGRLRSVPMPAWAKVAVDRWTGSAGIGEGSVFRSIDQTGHVGQGITAQAVFLIVREYAAAMELEFAPHDLRRTFAQLAHKVGVALEQIQLSLGHSSILTTERYLGVRQNLTDAPCDHLGLMVE